LELLSFGIVISTKEIVWKNFSNSWHGEKKTEWETFNSKDSSIDKKRQSNELDNGK
jgi:hypothetical protein